MVRLTFKLIFPLCALFLCALLYFASCKDDLAGKTYLVTDEVMMDDYIIQNDLSMERFLDIVDKAGFRGTVHAYGTYTFFVPTNSAVEEYLREKGGLDNLTPRQCADIVRFHIVDESILTEDFNDGRLPAPTMLRKYITTRTVGSGGSTTVQVNRQANILQKDILVGNGYINKIDKLLFPNPLTCGEQIEELGEEYSMFKEVLGETGWLDSLRVENDSTWFTVFLHTNESLAKNSEDSTLNMPNGIRTRADLITYLRAYSRLDVSSDDELLWYFAAYHCVKSLYYVADLTNVGALMTLAPNQTITVKRRLDVLLLNEFGQGKTLEPGMPVDKESEYTDLSCFNGVLIDVTGYIGPKKRGPQPVYWDVAEQPELVKNARFRRGSISITQDEGLAYSEMTPVLHEGQPLMINYAYFGSYDPRFALVNQDGLEIVWYRMKSLDFKLPMLNPGTYNVWVCYRRADVADLGVRGEFMQEGKESQNMNTIGFYDYISNDTPAEVLRVTGWKRYTAKERSTTLASIMLGTIAVESAGRHTLRFNVIRRGRTTAMWLDMIHFIPVGEDELWPRFDMMGNQIYPGTPCTEIWPTALSCSSNNDEY